VRRSARLLTVAGIAAILLVAAADATIYRFTGCSPNAHYSFVRSLYHGDPTIDRYQWQTCDKAFRDGHFYAAKAPGLALATLPVYAALRAVGVEHENLPSVANWRAERDNIRGGIWPLLLWGVVLPLAILLLLVRRVVDVLEPGYGIAVALILGIATLVFPYGSAFFAHSLSTCLGFAAFTVLFLERRSAGSLARVAAGGLVAGLAYGTEYPLAIVVAGLGLYAVSRGAIVRRGLAYGAGALVGALPTIAYAWWAFGSPIDSSYGYTVKSQGQTGHDIVASNGAGLFGVNTPSLHVGIQLLFASNGLLRIAPVLALAAPGLVLMYRRGWRAEALLVGGLAIAFVTYNSGYWQPFGGEAAGGPRFLTPLMPFLALPLAVMFRRFAAATLALAVVSAASMVVLVATSSSDIGQAFHRLRLGQFSETLLGAGSGWVGVAPLVVALVAACCLGALVVKRPEWSRRGLDVAVAALAAWLLLDGVGPHLLEKAGPAVDLAMLLAALACGLTVLCVYRAGLRALWRALPMIVLLAPSLARSPGAVLVASLATIVLTTPLALPGDLSRSVRVRLHGMRAR
jgi:hypothetical protein